MSRVRIGAASGRIKIVRPCRMQQRTVQFFRCALKVVMMVTELVVTLKMLGLLPLFFLAYKFSPGNNETRFT